MKKWIIAAFLGSVLSFNANAALETFKVNGQTIDKTTQEELIKVLLSRGATRTPQLEERVRGILIRDAVLLQNAKKQKLEKNKDVQRLITNAKNAILINAVANQWIKDHPVKDEEIKAVFEQQKERWGNSEVRIRHILVKDEAKAKELYDKVKNGASMEALAKDFSIDTPQNRAQGGLIDWTSPNAFEKVFAASFEKLKPGQLIEGPVRSSIGWHVAKLEDRREAQRYKNFEDHKKQLSQLLAQRHLQVFIDELIKNSKIEVQRSAK